MHARLRCPRGRHLPQWHLHLPITIGSCIANHATPGCPPLHEGHRADPQHGSAGPAPHAPPRHCRGHSSRGRRTWGQAPRGCRPSEAHQRKVNCSSTHSLQCTRRRVKFGTLLLHIVYVITRIKMSILLRHRLVLVTCALVKHILLSIFFVFFLLFVERVYLWMNGCF